MDEKRRAQVRAAQARYRQSEKYRATQACSDTAAAKRIRQARYEQSEHGRATRARYTASTKRRITQDARNKRRLFIGQRYVGKAATVEQAARIKSHIRGRLHGFVESQHSAENWHGEQ